MSKNKKSKINNLNNGKKQGLQESENVKITPNDHKDNEVAEIESDDVEVKIVVEDKNSKFTGLTFIEKIGCRLAKKFVDNLICQLNDLKVEKEGIISQLEELSSENNKQKETLEKLRQNNDALTGDKESLVEDRENLIKERDNLVRENDNLSNEKNSLIIENKELKKEKSSFDDKVKNLEDEKKRIQNKIKLEFKDITSDFMNIEDALIQIADALKKCKGEISHVENENESLKKKYNDAENRTKDAEQRIAKIESSDKGTLIVELEKAKNDLDGQIKLLNDKEAELRGFKENEYENLKRDKESADAKIEEVSKLFNKEKEAHCSSVEKHKEEIEKLTKQHKDELTKLDEEHKKEVKKIKEDNDERLKQNDELHAKEILGLKNIAAKKERELNARLEVEKKTIFELDSILKGESEKLRNSTIDVITKLHMFLKNNEVMAACSDDYRDKVEEKLQDLVFNSQEMINEISNLPQPKTPSEWKVTLNSYIVDRIGENTSLVNILLKYYILSNVPFMIDSERDNGIYFIRKNIKEAHDAIITILRQCDVTPILPSLFVENINEGLYEVEGQFNDIESFCPGSINEHIGHIERSSEGLNDILIGVTRVGYLIGDKKIIKAQVLIS